MIATILLVGAAVFLLGGEKLLERARAMVATMPRPKITWQQMAAVALLIGALASFNWRPDVEPAPVPPAPPAPKALSLDGLFAGPTAASDAQIVEALCGELADEIAWDGQQDAPYLKTGVAIDDLRQRARELRCRGVSIGARQPAARDAIAKHLEAAVGTAGGPITPEQRAAWVRAMREVSEAAADVTR
jgi:hypothetical protein